jgi:acyl-coenzyme A synthetase/AMP-(fatty) acid ligase
VVIPCFNEGATIGGLVEAVRRQGWSVFVVDDGSADGTSALAAQAGATVIRHDGNLGKGAALRVGLSQARAQGFEWCFTLDGDGQHAPEDLPAVAHCGELTGALLVVGNRMHNAQAIPWLRRHANRWMSLQLSRRAGQHLADTQCGFRLIHLETWADLPLKTQRFEVESETLMAFLAAGHQVAFAPIRVIGRGPASRIRPLMDSLRWWRWWRGLARRATRIPEPGRAEDRAPGPLPSCHINAAGTNSVARPSPAVRQNPACERNGSSRTKEPMLFERWQNIARDRRNEVALRELASGQCWTFAELDRQAEAPLRSGSELVCPQGQSAEFICEVLRGWRWQAVVYPLEPEEARPSIRLPPPPCCHLKSTSATAGAARSVAFTAEQLAADADNIVATMGLRPDWPNLGVISLAHSYGFSNLVLPLLLHGIPLFLAPAPLPGMLRSAAQAFPNLTLAGVPALWRAWHEARALSTNLRLAISAGAPLPLALEQAVFQAHGLKIHNFYGSSECGGIAYDDAPAPRQDEACVGRPMKNVEVTVNQEGTLVVRSHAVGETYWPEPADALGRGRFQTSDLAELKDGAVYLRGRTGDQINVAGRKVSPTTIEEALRGHDAVEECLVFAVPSRDLDRTDLIVACVAARRPNAAAELRQFLLGKLPGWQVPREWWFVESLGANGRGKVSRAQWRAEFLKRREREGARC